MNVLHWTSLVPRLAATWQDARRVVPVPDVVVFDLQLAHGRCLAVRLPEDAAGIDALAALLLPGEREFAAGFGPARRRTWIGGRAAMRLALDRIGAPAGAVLGDDRDAPLLPAGIAGSITHKQRVAAALVARQERARIGVDIEIDEPLRFDVSRRVLAEDEVDEVAALPEAERTREVLLRFSAKEALYKALDPFVRRYVAFGEVSVTPQPDGSARVRTRLPAAEGPFDVEVRWQRLDGLVLTTARVQIVTAS
jgi:enterobactin synthetase component D